MQEYHWNGSLPTEGPHWLDDIWNGLGLMITSNPNYVSKILRIVVWNSNVKILSRLISSSKIYCTKWPFIDLRVSRGWNINKKYNQMQVKVKKCVNQKYNDWKKNGENISLEIMKIFFK